MRLFLTLLPLYLLGNVHCAAMCGPLVALLGKRRYRHLYFLGRIASFTLAGLLAAEVGFILNLSLKKTYAPSLLALFFGLLLVMFGVLQVCRLAYPGQKWLARRTAGLSARLGALMAQDRPAPTFTFGVCTILLPCGQSLVVFSACALSGDPFSGLFNGFMFALLTSPALVLAMQAVRFIKKDIAHLTGSLIVLVGVLSCCRGLAELELIPHVALISKWHLILF